MSTEPARVAKRLMTLDATFVVAAVVLLDVLKRICHDGEEKVVVDVYRRQAPDMAQRSASVQSRTRERKDVMPLQKLGVLLQ